MNIIADAFKDLNDLKETVVSLKNDVQSIVKNFSKTTNKTTQKTNEIDENNIDYDLNKDGKISPIEIMLVKTIQAISSKQQDASTKNQHTALYMLISILLFLALQVILAAFGMQVSL